MPRLSSAGCSNLPAGAAAGLDLTPPGAAHDVGPGPDIVIVVVDLARKRPTFMMSATGLAGSEHGTIEHIRAANSVVVPWRT
ncbi:hypothetical protein GIY62_31705 [Burkholderia plantarii]|nr:hypothetical protein GIY62_31705 [Burkholderia plantarii]